MSIWTPILLIYRTSVLSNVYSSSTFPKHVGSWCCHHCANHVIPDHKGLTYQDSEHLSWTFQLWIQSWPCCWSSNYMISDNALLTYWGSTLPLLDPTVAPSPPTCSRPHCSPQSTTYIWSRVESSPRHVDKASRPPHSSHSYPPRLPWSHTL